MSNTVTYTGPIEPPKKYPVREVLDSLSWSILDYDDDYDGYLHIYSEINGAEIKIEIKKILNELGINPAAPADKE
jgi:hypothetical protein